jgi:hypothetical protein
MLSRLYPQEHWDVTTATFPSKTQIFLAKMMREIFPQTQVIIEYKHPSMFFPNTKRPVILDVFLPEFNLALEYQGIQHFALHFR